MAHYNREFVKMIRDKTRVHLKEASECYITGETTNLEIHHLYTLSELVKEFLTKYKLTVTDSNKLDIREKFVIEYKNEVQEQYVLAKRLHKKIHSLYGQQYSNKTAEKVKRWMEKQKAKYE